MGEIKQFASVVTPKPRFIFDNYKVSSNLFPKSQSDSEELTSDSGELDKKREPVEEKEDYFSFFNSHERIILKPESTFKGLRTFLVQLPIDYYILLQDGYDGRNSNDIERTNYIYMQNVPLL